MFIGSSTSASGSKRRPVLHPNQMSNKQSRLRNARVAMAALLSAVFGYADGVDVVPHTWLRNATPMVAARSNACAVPLADGRVLIAGGESAGAALASAETLANGRF